MGSISLLYGKTDITTPFDTHLFVVRKQYGHNIQKLIANMGNIKRKKHFLPLISPSIDKLPTEGILVLQPQNIPKSLMVSLNNSYYSADGATNSESILIYQTPSIFCR